MFTGLIKHVGVIQSIAKKNHDWCFYIESTTLCQQLKIGDSVSVNGVCLTVENVEKSFFQVTAVQETIRKTNLGTLKVNSFVNLEPALSLSDPLGGHLVQGHVDCTGKVIRILKTENSRHIEISIKAEFNRYLIEQGSIAINGISLTLVTVVRNRFKVVIIPHTWENTTLKYLHSGSHVNVEFDPIGKWVEKFNPSHERKSDLDIFRLKSMGY